MVLSFFVNRGAKRTRSSAIRFVDSFSCFQGCSTTSSYRTCSLAFCPRRRRYCVSIVMSSAWLAIRKCSANRNVCGCGEREVPGLFPRVLRAYIPFTQLSNLTSANNPIRSRRVLNKLNSHYLHQEFNVLSTVQETLNN